MVTRDYDGLMRFLAARARTPFAWGRNANDCCSHALGALAAQGRPVPADALPNWSSERGAKLALARLGGLEAAVDQILARIPPAMAQRGDIAGVRAENGELLLMVVEGETLVGPDASGARRVHRSRMVSAWSAG